MGRLFVHESRCARQSTSVDDHVLSFLSDAYVGLCAFVPYCSFVLVRVRLSVYVSISRSACLHIFRLIIYILASLPPFLPLHYQHQATLFISHFSSPLSSPVGALVLHHQLRSHCSFPRIHGGHDSRAYVTQRHLKIQQSKY